MEMILYIDGVWFMPKCSTWKAFFPCQKMGGLVFWPISVPKVLKVENIILPKRLPNLVKGRQGKLCLSKAQNKRLMLTPTMVVFVTNFGFMGVMVHIDLRNADLP